MKKEDIIVSFLSKRKIHQFEKAMEPSAVAFESFLKTGQNVSFPYFQKIYLKYKADNGI